MHREEAAHSVAGHTNAGNEVSVQVLLEGYSKSGMGSTILCTNCEKARPGTVECNNTLEFPAFKLVMMCKVRLLPLEMNIIVPTYHCRLWWVRAHGKFTQTYLSKLVNNFINLLLPDSQTLLQVKHRVLDGECN